MRDRAKILGWTGGVGMGKSASADILGRRNIPVIDTDLIARELVETGKPALEEVKATFGLEVMSSDGRLNRERLAEIVFGNPSARVKLEGILHPRIRSVWLEQVKEWRKSNTGVAVVIIPLLFETRVQAEFDAVVCVACTAETQAERLGLRGWAPETSERRIRAQWPIELKLRESDFVVWTEGPVENHREQIENILSRVQ